MEETITLKEDFLPEDESWEKGYWVLPKNRPLKIIEEEKDEVLVEYLDAVFYVPKELIEYQ